MKALLYSLGLTALLVWAGAAKAEVVIPTMGGFGGVSTYMPAPWQDYATVMVTVSAYKPSTLSVTTEDLDVDMSQGGTQYQVPVCVYHSGGSDYRITVSGLNDEAGRFYVQGSAAEKIPYWVAYKTELQSELLQPGTMSQRGYTATKQVDDGFCAPEDLSYLNLTIGEHGYTYAPGRYTDTLTLQVDAQ